MSCPYSFEQLWLHYPHPHPETRAVLYRALGWESLINDPDYENTCAIRMSVCLLRCGLTLPRGELTIWKGPLKNRKVMIRYDVLAKYLKLTWGDPEEIEPVEDEAFRGKKGVVVFFGLPGGYRGHIDLIKDETKPITFLWMRLGEERRMVCGSGCYPGSVSAWFWPAR